MTIKKYYYLIQLQYLGYRYHGWFIQPDVKTVQYMVNRTIKFVLGHDNFNTLGSSRTDKMVSANLTAFELFTTEPINAEEFLTQFNFNLPSDIRALEIQEVNSSFNIINNPKLKEYVYLFAFGQKFHPFCAPLVATIREHLDIELMKKGAALFVGIKNLRQYCTKPSPQTIFEREIFVSKIEENTLYTANFFPEKTYAFHIHSKGFMRYQVRLIMGQLIRLGRGEITLKDIEDSFLLDNVEPLPYIAPTSGLILNKIKFDNF